MAPEFGYYDDAHGGSAVVEGPEGELAAVVILLHS